MKLQTWLSRIALGAFALGVFVSCGAKTPQEAYSQDRVVGGLNILASNLDSSWLTQNPDSSGWRLRWTLPLTTSNIVGIYIFADSLDAARKSKLQNGNQAPDLSGLPSHILLPATDTSWQIPTSFLNGLQGKHLLTYQHYRFTVWVQYSSGPTGDSPFWELFLGDNIPPLVPFVLDSVGQTFAVLRFERPHDQTNTFDTVLNGPLESVRALYWPGLTPSDSAGKVLTVSVPADSLTNGTVDSFRLVLPHLTFWTHYCYALQIQDKAGNVSHSDAFQITTLDEFPPASPDSLAAKFYRLDSAVVSWTAASDTFQTDVASRSGFPNYHIHRYVLRVNGQRVDSLDLDPADSASFIANGTFQSGRFAWNGSVWSWYWRSLRPGKPFQIDLIVYDRSGNMAVKFPSVSGIAKPRNGIAGPCPAGWVGVDRDSTGLANFCIEEHEHVSGGRIMNRVTWAQALQACSDIGAELCSEAQWVRACETFPDTTAVATYGAIEAGVDIDTLLWLQDHCKLGTGDSSTMLDPTNSDPRCISGWGVYDMPGRVGEWTRDVYLTTPNATTNVEPQTLAYLGKSDLTLDASLGTIHGGSALLLDQADRTLASARCRQRNYPASSATDTLKDSLGTILATFPHPLPQGFSSGWGFRCCTVLP